jgi:membrane-bound serine protease (ClpP class)
MRKLVGVLTASLLVAGTCLGLAGLAAAADTRPVVSVIQISGLLDRVQADFLEHAIDDADASGNAALVVQLDSNRAVVSDQRMVALVNAVVDAKTPVGIWVGPARTASVGGEVTELLVAADVVGLAPGASIHRGPKPDLRSPTLGDFLIRLDGRGGITLPSKLIREGKTPRRQPLFDVRFDKPSLMARTIHGVTSPGPAYALLIFGLLLAILEFATAGIGLAAATAAIFLLLGCLGLGGLPVNGIAVAALVFAAFGFAIDVQAGAPRAWTAIGAGAMLFGTFSLYREGMAVPIVWMVGVIGLAAAFLFTGLPSLIRARFSSPTIGREGFVGEMGTAVGALAPDGVVNVRGATWRARTNRATPIDDGATVRVIGIDGLVLDVEPEEGAAKDYRNH